MTKRRAGFAQHGPWTARLAILRIYGDDAEFSEALVSLFERRYVSAEWPLESWRAGWMPGGDVLIEDLHSMAQRFGLDRMGPEGVEVIHRWCLNRAQFGESITPRELFMGLPEGYGVPDSEASMAVSWRPDQEGRKGAEARLTKAQRLTLDEIQSRWEADGWDFPDTSPKAQAHLLWLFLRMRHGWTYGEIARKEGLTANPYYSGPAKAVQRAVHAMAKRAAVTLDEGDS